MLYRRGKIDFILLLAVGLSVFSPAKAISQEPVLPPIEYAYPDQSVWTLQTDESGQLKNPLLKVADALFARAGIPWSSHAYPAGRMFQRLREGKSSFSMLVRASTLEEDCLFGESPVTYAELRIYRMKHSAPVTKIEDLAGKNLIAIRGYSYGKIGKYFRDPGSRITYFDTHRHEAAFKMLRHSRAEYLIDYAGPSEEVLAAEPIPEVTFDVLSRLDVYLVVSKKYPDAAKVLAGLERIAQTLDVRKWGLAAP